MPPRGRRPAVILDGPVRQLLRVGRHGRHPRRRGGRRGRLRRGGLRLRRLLRRLVLLGQAGPRGRGLGRGAAGSVSRVSPELWMLFSVPESTHRSSVCSQPVRLPYTQNVQGFWMKLGSVQSYTYATHLSLFEDAMRCGGEKNEKNIRGSLKLTFGYPATVSPNS